MSEGARHNRGGCFGVFFLVLVVWGLNQMGCIGFEDGEGGPGGTGARGDDPKRVVERQ